MTVPQQPTDRLTNSQKVAQSRQKLVAAGGRRLPTGYLQPDAAAALDALLAAGYASTATAAISTALLDAQRKIGRQERRRGVATPVR